MGGGCAGSHDWGESTALSSRLSIERASEVTAGKDQGGETLCTSEHTHEQTGWSSCSGTQASWYCDCLDASENECPVLKAENAVIPGNELASLGNAIQEYMDVGVHSAGEEAAGI